MAITYLDVTFAALGIYFLKRLLAPRQPAPFPPGPKGLPLVGNVADMPTVHEWKTFASWAEQYGDVIGVKILGQPLIILNTAEHAFAMLDKKSSIYSERPTLMMGTVLVGWEKTLAMTKYGDRFREIRKMLFGLMGTKSVVKKFEPLEELETHRFLRRVYENPDKLTTAIRQTAGAIILNISHGYEPKEKDDPIVGTVDLATEQFSESTQPGAFLVDVMPILRYVPAWFPGAGFQKKAALWRKTLLEMANIPHEIVKSKVASGTAIPSFTSTHLEKKDLSAQEEDNVKWAAASLYSGGADTAIYGFYLAMTLHPEVQKKAQAEIDSVIGNDRLPTYADRASLPYIEALLKEVFRWLPVAPLGLPHVAYEDDIYNGYYIPKGSLIIPNIWQMLHNPATYSSPLSFNPDRFLETDGHAPERDPRDFCFGFGRRVCPGLNLADASTWLSIASALAVFDITKAKDESGREIVPETEMLPGTISHPRPFKCNIKPRSAKAEELITSVDFVSA
ncbi:cytochrome P450 [Punctularia strigosozonata HHB-11173 SS5]|uniref:cytochrome P450 n=1 Tax=Punctularia strigosozonata (strain HHB-11173) TaxID=741275 RepID=UPI0004417669|nr:cytochrome P450 [Punctularia strigosozonata HHB-11173 SS5]EIN10379.1 cytochrome P450 [Punctularia strigosozonata HHB-11173 SS5]